MKVEYFNPFYQATNNVFELMLSVPVEKGDMAFSDELVSSKDANINLGVTGDLAGSILFSFPESMALEMVKIMCGMELKEIDSFVASALGEIANIVGGKAVTLLSENNYICDIVPPQITIGEYKSLSAASKKVLSVTMKSSIGDFDLNIFLKEK